MKIANVTRLVSALGKDSEIHRYLGDTAHPSTVQRWRVAGAIPVKWWRKLIVLGNQKGVNLDAEKMLSIHEGEEIDV